MIMVSGQDDGDEGGRDNDDHDEGKMMMTMMMMTIPVLTGSNGVKTFL